MTLWDVVVVGAGVAGSTVARELSRCGMNVLVCERLSTEVRSQVPSRIDTLPPEINPLLRQLELSFPTSQVHSCECPGIVSYWPHRSERDFLCSPDGSAWHVQRDRFDTWLRDEAIQAGATFECGTRIRKLRRTANGYELLAVREGQSHNVAGRFLVDATGPSATIARMMGASRRVHIQEVACRACLRSDSSSGLSDQDDRLWIERQGDGWWYAVPDQGDSMQVSFVGPSTWFTSDWQNMLCNELSKTRLLAKRGIAILKTPRWSTSVAQVGHLDRVAGEHWLAIGDAAVTWSPLAGQGIYRSLESVMIATESIIANSNGEKDALSYYAAHTRSRIQQLIYQWESIHTAVA